VTVKFANLGRAADAEHAVDVADTSGLVHVPFPYGRHTTRPLTFVLPNRSGPARPVFYTIRGAAAVSSRSSRNSG